MRKFQNKIRTIVADDDAAIRRLIPRLLGNTYRVFPADNGHEAYVKARGIAADVIILDLDMPECDGLTTLARFRSDDRLRDVPILVLTNDARRDSVVKALHAGASDYLLKATLASDRWFLRDKIDKLRRPKPTAVAPL